MGNETFNGKVLQALDLKADKDLLNVSSETLQTKVEATLFMLERLPNSEYRFVHRLENPKLSLYIEGSVIYDSETKTTYVKTIDGHEKLVYASQVPAVTEYWSDGVGNWYCKWNNGLLEQGGVVNGNGNFGVTTITMKKSFLNTNYSLIVTPNLENESIFTNTDAVGTTAYLADVAGVVTNKTVNSFKISSRSTHCWFAKGIAV